MREHLNECISAAVLAAANKADDAEVLRRLLNHVNQRFRFNYVLGNGPAVAPRSSDFDDDEEESEGELDLLSEEERDAIDVLCARPLDNSSCLILPRIGEGRRDEVEARCASRPLSRPTRGRRFDARLLSMMSSIEQTR